MTCGTNGTNGTNGTLHPSQLRYILGTHIPPFRGGVYRLYRGWMYRCFEVHLEIAKCERNSDD